MLQIVLLPYVQELDGLAWGVNLRWNSLMFRLSWSSASFRDIILLYSGLFNFPQGPAGPEGL